MTSEPCTHPLIEIASGAFVCRDCQQQFKLVETETLQAALTRAEQAEKARDEQRMRAIAAEHHRTLELLSKGSATEQLELDLRTKLAEAQIALQEAEAARARLLPYVQHTRECIVHMTISDPGGLLVYPSCTCGLDEARQ